MAQAGVHGVSCLRAGVAVEGVSINGAREYHKQSMKEIRKDAGDEIIAPSIQLKIHFPVFISHSLPRQNGRRHLREIAAFLGGN